MKRIESVKNAKVKEWKKLHTKKGRQQTGHFIIEGLHLVEEAMKHNVEIVEIIVREHEDYLFQIDTKDIPIVEVTAEVMNTFTETQTPQGIAAVCKQLNNSGLKSEKVERVLLIDGVQDPGNLGTIIRTADSAGMDGVIIGKGSADPYNSKVVRSTQGSIFHLPVFEEELKDVVPLLKRKGLTVYGTSLSNAVDFEDAVVSGAFAIIVGNEGQGVQKELLELTDQNIYIPIYGKAESLNVAVAAGILMYHFVKYE